jgi:hypothetical protein
MLKFNNMENLIDKTHRLFTPSELELFQSIFGMERIRLGFFSGKDEIYEHSYMREGFRYWERRDIDRIEDKVKRFNSQSNDHIIIVKHYNDGEDEYDMDRSYPASYSFIVESKK